MLPKTSKGKTKKLNYTAITAMNGIGTYFSYNKYITIANFTTQKTYYSSYESKKEIIGFDGLQKWLEHWISETTDDDLKDIEHFKASKKQRYKYNEGDFFSFKTARREYGFGRILLDVTRVRKAIVKGKLRGGHRGLLNLIGKALIVKEYKKRSNSLDIDLDELKKM